MYSLHAIVMPAQGVATFGKGLADEAAVRNRLVPEHEGAVIILGPGIQARPEADLRYLMLLDMVRGDHGEPQNGWWRIAENYAALYIHATMRSLATTPAFSPSAECLIQYRLALDVDQGVIAAMIGKSKSHVCRLENGVGQLKFEDYRRLRFWAGRLGVIDVFDKRFEIGPVLTSAPVAAGEQA